MPNIVGFMNQELSVGMRVSLAQDGSGCPLNVGESGVIMTQLNANSQVLVEFDTEHPALHSGDGRCRNYHGYNVYPTYLSAENLSVYDMLLDKFGKDMDTLGKYIVIHGNVFELSELNVRSATDLLRHRDAQVQETYRCALESVKLLEHHLRQRYARKLLFPQLNASHVISGVIAYRSGDEMHICKPFTYAPQFIHYDDETMALSDRHKRSTAKTDLLIDITIPTFSTVLRFKADMRIFHHYHCMGSQDCIGTLDLTPFVSGDELTLISRVSTLAMKIQDLFKTINMNDAANKEPTGMPDIDSLWEDAHDEVKDTGVLNSSAPRPSVTTPTNTPTQPMFPNGCHVHVVNAEDAGEGSFTEDDIAIVKHFYDEQDHADDPFYAVEFLESNGERHDCDGHCEQGHGWYVRQSNLRFLLTPTSNACFHIGDRIVVFQDHPTRQGLTGTVRQAGGYGDSIACEMDVDFEGGRQTESGARRQRRGH